MTLKKAHKILRKRGIVWFDYFNLMQYRSHDTLLNEAITRIQTFLTIGY